MKLTGLATDVYWSFLNEVTHQQTDGLNFQQASFIVSLIMVEHRETWLVWHEGLKDWINLVDCKEFEGSRTSRTTPPLPPTRNKNPIKPAVEEEESDFNHIDNRLNRRFVKNFGVEVNIMGTIFKTKTVNVSIGGMRLQDPMPANVGSTFTAQLSRKNGTKLNVFCTLVKTPKGQEGLLDRVRILGAEKEGVLRNWLIDSGTD